MRHRLLISLLLAGITLAVYWPVHRFGPVYFDDPIFLTETPEIQSGLDWHSFVWSFSSVLVANWHPVTTLSFVIDHQLFGTCPPAEHLVNALFHAANAALLFLLFATLTGSTWRSALVAALFAWHPLRVESVAWITERKDVLSGFFFLLTLLGYARYAAERKIQSPKSGLFLAASLAAFTLGLMSKAMLVTVPFVLLLVDFWPLRRFEPETEPAAPAKRLWPATAARLVWEKWPYFALSAVFSFLTYSIQKNYAAVVPLKDLGWDYRFANIITSYFGYLGKTFWPVDLAAIYPFHRIDDWLQTGVIALGLLFISGICLLQIRRRPWLTVGWLWYLGTALPVIGLVQVGGAAMADRYSYLILIGPVFALVWSLPDAWANRKPAQYVLAAGATGVLGGLLVLTRIQTLYWQDTITLFTHTIAVTGDNGEAETSLACGLERAGRLEEALVHDRRAIALNPNDRENYVNAGHVLMLLNQWAEAAEDSSTALTMDPNDLTSHETLGIVLPHLGRYAEAAQHWDAVLKIAPDNSDALNNFAWLLATCPEPSVRDGKRAVELASQACQLTRFKVTYCLGTLAAAYAEAGRFDDAIAAAQKACAGASAQGDQDLLKKNQELLALYRQHKPYHEAAEKLVPAAP